MAKQVYSASTPFVGLVVLIFALSGCGGSYTSRVSARSGTTTYIDSSVASEVRKGLEEVTISEDGLLTVQVVERRLSPEFEAPVVVDKLYSGERANPVGSVLGAAFTAGLYPLFAPKKFLEKTFGKTTEERVLSSNIDKSKARRTGRDEWVTIPLRDARVVISGLPDGEKQVVLANADGVSSLDLKSSFFSSNANPADPLSLEVSCQNCQSTNSESLLTKRKIFYEPPVSWRVMKTFENAGGVVWAPSEFLNHTGPATGGISSKVLTQEQSWVASIQEKIRNKIVFDIADNNPVVVYVVRQNHEGKIDSVKLESSSGDFRWNIAVRNAIWASDPLPLYPDGSVMSPLTLTFRPKPVTFERNKLAQILDPDLSLTNASTEIATWGKFSFHVAQESQKLLSSKQALPEYLVRERARLEGAKPKPNGSLTRDEFESTIAFKARVKATQLAERSSAQAYNREVELFNQKVRKFRQETLRTLTDKETGFIMTRVLSKFVGDPVVKSVAYDADLERFMISVAGDGQPEGSDIQFGLVSAEQIPPIEARGLKDQLLKAKPFIRFDLNGTTLSPASAELVNNHSVVSFRFIDGFSLPKFQTVRLNPAQLRSPDTVAKVSEENTEREFVFNTRADPETERLRAQLESLRESLYVRKQVESERESLTLEIKRLEQQLNEIGQGEFEDDIQELLLANPKPSLEDPNLHVVVVGVDLYSEFPRVVFADRSARSFAEVVSTKFGAPVSQVISLINEDATGVRILSRLRSVASRLDRKDKLIFYFAGHSAPTKDKQVVLIPYDATAESPVTEDLQIKELLNTLLDSKAEHIWVILDSCFSGRTDENDFIYKGTAPILLTEKSGILPKETSRLSLLAAGGSNDFANVYRQKGHRLFSYHLLGTMLRESQIDAKGFSEVSSRVRADSAHLGRIYKQNPEWLGVERALLVPNRSTQVLRDQIERQERTSSGPRGLREILR